MVLVAEVDALLDRADAPEEARLRELLDAWLTECERSAPVDEESKYNEMHVVGLGLCALLHRCELGGYASFSLAAALGAHAARVVLHAEAVSEMTWLQLSETLTAVQLDFDDAVGQRGRVPLGGRLPRADARGAQARGLLARPTVAAP